MSSGEECISNLGIRNKKYLKYSRTVDLEQNFSFFFVTLTCNTKGYGVAHKISQFNTRSNNEKLKETQQNVSALPL